MGILNHEENNNYHAVIINLSQLNKDIFNQLTIIEIQKRFLGIIKLYKITIPESDLQEVVLTIQANMGNALKKEWYATFYNSEKAIIVFRKKIFELSTYGIVPVYQQVVNTINAVDKEKWDEVIRHAQSLRIPDNQLDFLPPDFTKEIY